MEAQPDVIHPSKSLPGGTVTFLFTDMEGSTSLVKKLGEAYAQVLARQRQILRAAFESCQGQEVDTQGDAFFVAFAHAGQAIAAAIQAQQSLAAQAWPEGLEVRVRMGLHTGDANLTPDGYVGMDVHRAARICSAGHGGQVLLSASTNALVANNLPERIHLRDLGKHRLKDLSYPEHIFHLDIPGLPGDFPALKSLDARLNNLPAQLTSFIGRQEEIDQIHELLGKVRLITITGPGGSGKSRLSLQAAANLVDQFPDGVWFVPLATLDSVDEITLAIANVLHFRPDTYASNLDPLTQLSDFLTNRSLLLVLDNFEHLLDGAGCLKEILSRAPQVKILLSSRERLNLPEEWVLALSGMKTPHNGHKAEDKTYNALTLFLERARQANPAYTLSPLERPYAIRICHLVEGMPLGIELAAPWTALLSCREIAQELENNLDFLKDTYRGMPEGHRSLRAVFEHSWRLLDESEQVALSNLAVFQGDFDHLAAGKVAELDLPMLMDLVNKSLVQRGEAERFQMHALLHQFAAEHLQADPAREARLRESHSRLYLTRLKIWQTSSPGDLWQQALEKILAEQGNIRGALRWALIHWKEAEAGQVLEHAFEFHLAQGFYQASTAYQSIIQFLRENGASLDEDAPRRSLLLKAITDKTVYDAMMGDPAAEAVAQECLPILRGLDLSFELGNCLMTLGVFADLHSNCTEAIKLLEEARHFLSKYSFERTAGCLLWLGWAYYEQGDYSRAKEYYLEGYELSKQQGVGILRPYSLDKLGIWADATGDFSQGLQYHQQALESFKQLGDQAGQGFALTRMSFSALNLGDYQHALQYGRAGHEQFESIGHRWGIATGLCRIGFAELGLESYPEAQAHFLRGLKVSHENHYPATASYALMGLASLRARQGQTERAVEVLAFASEHTTALYKKIGEKELTRLRAVLGDESFSAAQRRGRALEFQALVDDFGQPQGKS
jgi:predicted ATPase/class 3 adenylate cyclase